MEGFFCSLESRLVMLQNWTLLCPAASLESYELMKKKDSFQDEVPDANLMEVI